MVSALSILGQVKTTDNAKGASLDKMAHLYVAFISMRSIG